MVLLDYMKANRLLNKYGIRSIRSKYVKNADDAIDFSNNGRIVLKVISQKALHKSRSGLVALDLGGEKEIRGAYNTLARKAEAFRPYKILAQCMVSGKGIEIIVGGNTDQQFGKMVLVGLGGIYVETFHDFSMRLCPISRHDAKSMLHQLKSFGVIAQTKKAENEIESLLVKVSRMFMDNDMKELDLNPVIIHDGVYDAVDLRLIR
jgi:succinyl-CoA synthetase beta subunit